MNKSFDCVELKHQGAERIRKRIGKLNTKEELQFWREMTVLLKTRKSKLLEKVNP